MVILQFNKLIRNKWVWGVFAIAVSAFFCFDDAILRGGDEASAQAGENVGTLGGREVKGSLFAALVEDIRGIGSDRDWRRKTDEVNRQAWETLATLAVAKANGLEATDAEVQEVIRNERAFQVNGQFSFAKYNALLREKGILPERFEDYLRRNLTAMHVERTLLADTAWIAPMELDRAVADRVDALTVRVARFTQSDADAAKVTLDAAGLKKWYDENTNSIALPACQKIRFVKFDATDAQTLAKMSVSEDALRDHYDANIDKYTVTDTNGVDQVKKFEEVRDELDHELRILAAVEYFETNLNQRVYGVKAAEGSSRLDEIAKEDALQVATSDWFSTEGGFVEGFMALPETICPGANGFLDAVAELDASSEDLRYGIVLSENAVWLIEPAETRAAKLPTFEEAQEIIRPRALAAAKEDAFKAAVEAIAAQGTNAVLATDNVSTNYTFALVDLRGEEFPDQYAVARAACKLQPGEISEFVGTGVNTALLVVCVDRQAGDPGKAVMLRTAIRGQLEGLSAQKTAADWRKWNLARLGFETTSASSVEPEEEEE